MKILLLSRIKGLIFVLKLSTEYKIDFIYLKKRQAKFLLRLTIYALMVSAVTFVFKIIGPIIFSAAKKLFHSQETFPQLKIFFTVMDRDFSQPKNFSTVR